MEVRYAQNMALRNTAGIQAIPAADLEGPPTEVQADRLGRTDPTWLKLALVADLVDDDHRAGGADVPRIILLPSNAIVRLPTVAPADLPPVTTFGASPRWRVRTIRKS